MRLFFPLPKRQVLPLLVLSCGRILSLWPHSAYKPIRSKPRIGTEWMGCGMIPNYSTYLKKTCNVQKEPLGRLRVGQYSFAEKRGNGETNVDGERIPGKRRQSLTKSGMDVRHGIYGPVRLRGSQVGDSSPAIAMLYLRPSSGHPTSQSCQGLPFWLLRKSSILRGIEIACGGIPFSCGWENLWGGFLALNAGYQECDFTWDRKCQCRQVLFVRPRKSVNETEICRDKT